MSTAATRRGMLGWLASAPLAAKEAVSSAATAGTAMTEAAAVANVASMAAVSTGVPPMMGRYLGVLEHPQALALIHSGLAPEWMSREVENLVAERSRVLDPDIAGLRSMSVSARMRLQCRREKGRFLDEATWQHAFATPRRLFWSENAPPAGSGPRG